MGCERQQLKQGEHRARSSCLALGWLFDPLRQVHQLEGRTGGSPPKRRKGADACTHQATWQLFSMPEGMHTTGEAVLSATDFGSDTISGSTD